MKEVSSDGSERDEAAILDDRLNRADICSVVFAGSDKVVINGGEARLQIIISSLLEAQPPATLAYFAKTRPRSPGTGKGRQKWHHDCNGGAS